eukprot:6271610-Alexandrium_andersonii.AAC.1
MRFLVSSRGWWPPPVRTPSRRLQHAPEALVGGVRGDESPSGEEPQEAARNRCRPLQTACSAVARVLLYLRC